MENENEIAAAPDANELQAQCLWLRKQILAILVLLIVISGTFNLFLLRQWRYASADVKAMRAQFGPMIDEYQKSMGPQMDEFVRRVTEYGRTHPDFAPIMTKYRLQPAAAPVAPVTPAAPAKK